MKLSERGWVQALSNADDLDKVQRALTRETAIREIMQTSGESREIVTEQVNAMEAMNQEAVLDLCEGEPTTLRDALSRYIDELEKRDELQPRDRIIDDLNTLVIYPWSGEVVSEEPGLIDDLNKLAHPSED